MRCDRRPRLRLGLIARQQRRQLPSGLGPERPPLDGGFDPAPAGRMHRLQMRCKTAESRMYDADLLIEHSRGQCDECYECYKVG